MKVGQRSLIITTCGHIDHGKTALVKALAGTDTARLPEEQRRGMTIELGYARWKLADNLIAGFVDVPGHEKLLRNMLAGCVGADIAMLVIDVHEGIRQQTLEHLAVMEALKISAAAVVFSKCATAGTELLTLRRNQLAEQVQGTIFEQAPVFCVDSVTGSGLAELQVGVMEIASSIPPKKLTTAAKIWIDRVFSKHGIGTIVTGSLLSGKIRVGDNLRLLPQQEYVRVRAIQVFGESADVASAGTRVALNITRSAHEVIARETLLTGCGKIVVDKQCWLQPFANIQPGAVRGYLGTLEITGRIKRIRKFGRERWLFISNRQFPVDEDASILFRALNSRAIIGAAKIAAASDYSICPADIAVAGKKIPTDISIGNVRYSFEQVEKYTELLRKHFALQPTITLAQFRDIAQLNREQAKNILEHFDTQKLTLRAGDNRGALEKLYRKS
ncbi:MAG: selenocysteine-specific translation elongation factor [Negativicutes bacterium]|jgi:selenocysteine-specific translation elongation factor